MSPILQLAVGPHFGHRPIRKLMTRTYDAYLVSQALDEFLEKDTEVDPIDWVSLPTNIALINDRGDLAIFEIGFKNVYTGHYYFKSRGRAAITAAREFIDELFNTCYNISVLLGLTPLTNRPARWLSRQVGFKSYGIVHNTRRHCEMFIITKKEFNANG